MKTTIIDTVLGPARLAAEGDALVGLWFRGQQHEPAMPLEAVTVEVASDTTLRVAADWLADHLAAGASRTMPNLAPRGTDFQQAVWAALRQIPRGETTTYGALAQALGKPSATRAVAAAVGRNPISVLIPCHRVIGSNGSLTGYAGGLGRKQSLLALETDAVLPWQRASQAYRAQYADPIDVQVGDQVQWLDREDDGEFPGWKWAVASDGRSGWAPIDYFKAVDRGVRARRSYCARELSIERNELLLALDAYSGWTYGITRTGQHGWLPSSTI
jgi:methylated-DNA-[protein]-cysteine S-methyltransferase